LSGKLLAIPQYHAQALTAAEKAFALDPNDPAAAAQLSQMASASKDCGIIKQLADQPGKSESAGPMYASCLAAANLLDEAAAQYLRLIQAKPELAQYHIELARVYLRKNAPELAREQLLWIADRADSMPVPVLTEALLNLARIFESQGRLDSALNYYRRYLEQKPEDQAVRNAIEKIEHRGKVEMIHSPWEIKSNPK
jgi:tetratricopeptide (TPR) repeat protein